MPSNPVFNINEFRERLDQKAMIFDPESFLLRIDGDRELFRDLIDMVGRNLPEQIELARGAKVKDDMDELRLYSHRIKGSADNVSAMRVREVAFLIEKQALSGNRENLEVLLDLLEDKIHEFRKHTAGQV